MSIPDLTSEILRFRDERDWQQFHSLRHLSAAVAVEAAEVQEILLWKSDEEASQFVASPKGHLRLREELADVFIYTLLLAEKAGIGLESAVRAKLESNAQKYPISQARGNATKYSDREPSNDQ